MGVRTKILKVLVETATLAVKLKHRSIRREFRRAVSRELHIKQFEETEDELIEVLTPVIEDQIRGIAEGLRRIDGGKSEEWLIRKYHPGQPRDDSGRWTGAGGRGLLFNPLGEPDGQESNLVLKVVDGLAVKSPSDAAHNLIQQAFDPEQWREQLTNAALPVLAVKMAESATAYLLSLGFDVRGRKSFEKSAGGDEQFYARENEKLLAGKLGGKTTGVTSPVDVTLKIKGRWHGVELKTLLDNKHEKIKVDPPASSRKEEWEQRTGGTIHTVVFDDSGVVPGKTRRERIQAIRRRREDGDSGGFDTSKRVIYYKRGWGGFRLGGMTQVGGGPWVELKRLMSSEVEDGEKYHPGQPRDDSGRFSSGAGSSRSERARRTHKPSTGEKQRRGEAEQLRLAGLVGGRNTDDNAPFDVIVGGKHGVEVKTVIDNNNDKLTVHPESRRRKERRAKEKGYQMHMVGIDVRGGGRTYYYKGGIGAYRLGSMDKVSISQLRELLR